MGGQKQEAVDEHDMTAKESQIEESQAFQFDGDGTASSHQEFKVIDVQANQEQTAKQSQLALEMPSLQSADLPQQNNVKYSQPASLNKPYTFDPNEETSAQESNLNEK